MEVGHPEGEFSNCRGCLINNLFCRLISSAHGSLALNFVVNTAHLSNLEGSLARFGIGHKKVSEHDGQLE